jgi:hypothetical protein
MITGKSTGPSLLSFEAGYNARHCNGLEFRFTDPHISMLQRTFF